MDARLAVTVENLPPDDDWQNRQIGLTTKPRSKGGEWTDSYHEATIRKVLESIKQPPAARISAVDAVRAAKTQAERTEAKLRLPSAIFAGRIEGDRRKEQNFIDHSGVAFFDYEFEKDAAKAADMRDELFANEYVAAAWISSSGGGVHALVRFAGLPPDHKTHTATHKAAQAKLLESLSGSFDATTERVRYCFLSYDPDIRIRNDSTPFPLAKPKPTPRPVKVEPPGDDELGRRIEGSLAAIRDGLVGGPYVKGTGTAANYNDASKYTWSLSQYVNGDGSVMAAWLAKLEGDGRIENALDRKNFEAKWRTGEGLDSVTAGSFVWLVREEAKAAGVECPLPMPPRRKPERKQGRWSARPQQFAEPKVFESIPEMVAELNSRFACYYGTEARVIDEAATRHSDDLFPQAMSLTAFKERLCHVKVKVVVENEYGMKEEQLWGAAKQWLKHPDRRRFSSDIVLVGPDEDPTEGDPRFNPYPVIIAPPALGEDEGRGDPSVLVDYLLNIVCGGDQRCYEWVADFMADIVQTRI